MSVLLKIIIVATLALTIITVSFLVGFGTASVLNSADLMTSLASRFINRNSPTTEEAEYFGVFWEAWHIVERDFYGDLPAGQQITYGAIRGVLGTLDDPHTAFVEPKPRQREKEDLQGSFGGIGAWVRIRPEDGAIFLTPMENLPAMRAGIQDGDVVLKVEDTEITPEITLDDVLALIRGPVGTSVTLTISRAGREEPLVFEIIREKIETPTVTWELLEGNVGYVSISLFGERTNNELKEAIGDLRNQGMTKLILDLRNDPGGLLDTAVQVASQFLDGGVVLFEQRRDSPEKTYSVKRNGIAQDIPLVVLVNGGTASASEIVAGAIQDHGRGILIGEHTFGKGSVQLVYDLSDGSSLHVTVAYWLTPNRHEISGNGLSPDFEVPLSQENRDNDEDPQLEKALAYLETIQ